MAKTVKKCQAFDIPPTHLAHLHDVYDETYRSDAPRESKSTEPPSFSQFCVAQYLDAYEQFHTKNLADLAGKVARQELEKALRKQREAELAAAAREAELEAIRAACIEVGIDPDEVTLPDEE